MLSISDVAADELSVAPEWRGFHHVALVTRDLDATITFYRDVLGMEILFVAPPTELHGRHAAILPGGETDRLGLHFFEYAQAPLFGPDDRNPMAAVFDPGATFLSHISLALPDSAAGAKLRDRLARHGVDTSAIMDQGVPGLDPIQIIGFFDNNGLPVEAAWPTGVADVVAAAGSSASGAAAPAE